MCNGKCKKNCAPKEKDDGVFFKLSYKGDYYFKNVDNCIRAGAKLIIDELDSNDAKSELSNYKVLLQDIKNLYAEKKYTEIIQVWNTATGGGLWLEGVTIKAHDFVDYAGDPDEKSNCKNCKGCKNSCARSGADESNDVGDTESDASQAEDSTFENTDSFKEPVESSEPPDNVVADDLGEWKVEPYQSTSVPNPLEDKLEDTKKSDDDQQNNSEDVPEQAVEDEKKEPEVYCLCEYCAGSILKDALVVGSNTCLKCKQYEFQLDDNLHMTSKKFSFAEFSVEIDCGTNCAKVFNNDDQTWYNSDGPVDYETMFGLYKVVLRLIESQRGQ